MTVIEIENRVFEIEGVRIVIRAAAGKEIGDYDYSKAYPRGNSIRQWLDSRILDRIDGNNVVVIDGTGALPNRKTHMVTLRDSYSD